MKFNGVILKLRGVRIDDERPFDPSDPDSDYLPNGQMKMKRVRQIASGEANAHRGDKLQFDATPVLVDGSRLPGRIGGEPHPLAVQVFGTADQGKEFCQSYWRFNGEDLSDAVNVGSRDDDYGCTPVVKLKDQRGVLEFWTMLRDIPGVDFDAGKPPGEEHESEHFFINVR